MFINRRWSRIFHLHQTEEQNILEIRPIVTVSYECILWVEILLFIYKQQGNIVCLAVSPPYLIEVFYHHLLPWKIRTKCLTCSYNILLDACIPEWNSHPFLVYESIYDMTTNCLYVESSIHSRLFGSEVANLRTILYIYNNI